MGDNTQGQEATLAGTWKRQGCTRREAWKSNSPEQKWRNAKKTVKITKSVTYTFKKKAERNEYSKKQSK